MADLFAEGHAATEGGRQADRFGDERAERQILFEHDAAQDRLHLRNSRSCNHPRDDDNNNNNTVTKTK